MNDCLPASAELYKDDFKPGNMVNNSHVCIFLPMTV